MCGVAGIVLVNGRAPMPDAQHRLVAMSEAMRHRGPDDEGTYLSTGARVGLVQHLRGMFAFAIWDAQPGTQGHGRVFIARDRLGIKSLYYAATSEGFLFASELKALLASGLVSREISPAGLVGYLMMGSVP